MRFIDEIDIVFTSGKGGDGAISFLRERCVPRGGPDGGDGGKGGDIVVTATRQKNTLVDFRRNKVYKAESGRAGGGKRMHGKSGKTLHIAVPIGTIIHDREDNSVLADLDTDGSTWVIPGGGGGKGNVHFKTAQRRTPRMATPGKEGHVLSVRLELKLLADVGLLGFPNAGKSTLISVISEAKPRVADYPFTTLVPKLGVVRVTEDDSFVVADIPGLVEGASEGIGLGHQFLRHVERCAAYIHLIDIDDSSGETAIERWAAIQRELQRYDETLTKRPQILALNKLDLVDAETHNRVKAELEQASGQPVRTLSALTRDGVRELIFDAWEHVQRKREAQRADEDNEDAKPVD